MTPYVPISVDTQRPADFSAMILSGATSRRLRGARSVLGDQAGSIGNRLRVPSLPDVSRETTVRRSDKYWQERL